MATFIGPGRPHPERAGIDTHIVIPREKDVGGEKTLGKLELDGRTNIQTASSSAARRICRPPSLCKDALFVFASEKLHPDRHTYMHTYILRLF